MRIIAAVARELFGLFVDDGAFAVAIAAWLAVGAATLPRLAPDAALAGIALFAGLTLILFASLRRASRPRAPHASGQSPT
jgi:hypothetical protein